jgi:hypothetical protein
MFDAVADPVTKVPSTPIAGASTGQAAPAPAAASASAAIIPACTITLDKTSIKRSAAATGPSRTSAAPTAPPTSPPLPVTPAPTSNPTINIVPG